MKVLTVSRACLVGTLALGLLAALTAGTPQRLSENSIAVGGACNDCSGLTPTSCQEESGEDDCTDTTAFLICYSDAPDSGSCSKTGMVMCADNCKIYPNRESCN